MTHSNENLRRAAEESGGTLIVVAPEHTGCGAPVEVADAVGHIPCGIVLQGFGGGTLARQFCPACEELMRGAAARPSDSIKIKHNRRAVPAAWTQSAQPKHTRRTG